MTRSALRPLGSLIVPLLAVCACSTPEAREAEPVDAPGRGAASVRADGAADRSADRSTGTALDDANRSPGEQAPPTLPADGWREATVAGVSNAGSYRVHYRPVGGSIERGEPFGLEVWVLDPRTERPRTDVALAVDAAMPEHEHGMNREPRVTPEGKSPTGAFEVEGMLFHMLGRWELYLDVTRGAITERAQFEVRLE